MGQVRNTLSARQNAAKPLHANAFRSLQAAEPRRTVIAPRNLPVVDIILIPGLWLNGSCSAPPASPANKTGDSGNLGRTSDRNHCNSASRPSSIGTHRGRGPEV